MSEVDLKSALIKLAKQQGFDDIGIASPKMAEQNRKGLKTFLELGWQGDMEWMGENSDRRECPSELWSDVKSVIMLAMNYAPENNPLPSLEQKSNGVISVYAKGKDYHSVIKQKLKNIARWIAEQTGEDVKVFVDTAPLMEKPLAMSAGLGWQGKHTNLVSRKFGSWTFLGAVLTTHEFAPDKPSPDHCGSCDKCLKICPTDAFPAAYQLNATKCISYLTIEYKGIIPIEFRKAIGNRIYGCDDCLAICPWNKYAKTANEIRFHARRETDNPPLEDLLQMGKEEFQERFKGTPVKRAGFNGFIRNCLIAAGNSCDKNLLPQVMSLMKSENIIVRAAAVWAYGELAEKEDIAQAYAASAFKEKNIEVIEEWQRIKA